MSAPLDNREYLRWRLNADSESAIAQCQRILTFVNAAWSALSDA